MSPVHPLSHRVIASVMLAGLSATSAHAQYTYNKYLEPPTGKAIVGIGPWTGGGTGNGNSDKLYWDALKASPLVSASSPAFPGVKKVRINISPSKSAPHAATYQNCLDALTAGDGPSGEWIPEVVISFYDTSNGANHDYQVTPNTDADYNQDMIDQIVFLGEALETFGKPVFCCIGQEFNNHFSDSAHDYHPYDFPITFRVTRGILENEGARCAYIWTWEASALTDYFATHPTTGEPKWYPGDEYVDWFGLDAFSTNEFTDSSADSGFDCGFGVATPQISDVATFLEAADTHGCPVFLETSSVDVQPDGIEAGTADTSNALGEWFDPFEQDFVPYYPGLKVILYVSHDWRNSDGGPACWENGRIDINDEVMAGWIDYLESSTTPIYMGEAVGPQLNGYDGWWGLGNSLAGAYSPTLIGSGTVTPGSTVSLDLANAKPNWSATMFSGLTAGNSAYHGGILVPTPTWMQTLATDGSGAVHMSWTWPSSSTPAEVYYQCWIKETNSPATYAASNALVAITIVP